MAPWGLSQTSLLLEFARKPMLKDGVLRAGTFCKATGERHGAGEENPEGGYGEQREAEAAGEVHFKGFETLACGSCL